MRIIFLKNENIFLIHKNCEHVNMFMHQFPPPRTEKSTLDSRHAIRPAWLCMSGYPLWRRTHATLREDVSPLCCVFL